jgi:hypothetical protein
LFEAACDLLKSHPLASPDQYGRPLGDGYGMEELVEAIQPLFVNERSLVKWVGLRGALPALWQCGPDVWELASEAVGLVYRDYGEEGEWEVAATPSDMNQEAVGQALGLHATIMMKVSNYDEIQELSLDEVRTDPRWFLSSINALHGFDFIAWTAIVLARLDGRGLLPPVIGTPPPPSALEQPGWYVDPMFAKGDRYWDGTDWTPDCRQPGGRGNLGVWQTAL